MSRPRDEARFELSLEIDNFLGAAGLGELLSWISASRAGGVAAPGVVNLDEYGT